VEAGAPEAHAGTVWDEHVGGGEKNKGIRSDQMLRSPEAGDRRGGVGVDRNGRGWEKPSDHVPVWVRLAA